MMSNKKNIICCLLVMLQLGWLGNLHCQKPSAHLFSDTLKRKQLLKEILANFPPDRTHKGRVSFLDETFQDWLKRTGELPPDFDKMPSIPLLPDPLVINEGYQNIPIKTKEQWQQQREKMKDLLQYYITGTRPPEPGNVVSEIISTEKEGDATIQKVRLKFGPGHRATLLVELIIPPGRGPFPVFLTQWNHEVWAKLAVKRGYVGCVFAGADELDDTEAYSEIWADSYDFTRLMRRAFGASRAIDYLYTLSFVDKNKIGMAGHSRHGKQSLWAAAFDERINAVVVSSGGTGGEVPWRYTSQKYDVEDIALLASQQPSWLHPRLRFFTGRENKLPVDQNFFMALIAPRGLMLSYAINEVAANGYGIEQGFHSAKKVYQFLNAADNVAIRPRPGQHGTVAADIYSYIDFFDYIFKRGNIRPDNKLYFKYSFVKWKKKAEENINPLKFPLDKSNNSIASEVAGNLTIWETKKKDILKNISFILGEAPKGALPKGPVYFKNLDMEGEDYPGNTIARPYATEAMGKIMITPYESFGDYLYGTIYYPKNKEAEIKAGTAKLSVVIFLHEYDYSKGFSAQSYEHRVQPFFEDIVKRGYVIVTYDMLGFGNRFQEQQHFYDYFPRWSKMGKMVNDLYCCVEAVSNLNFIDNKKINVIGYALGATVALYGAAFDDRIAHVISVCGFTPLRTNTEAKGRGGLKNLSHMEGGLIPRLGFFIGNEQRVPFDYHEVLAAIAPRKVTIVAPKYDKDADWKEVEQSVTEAKKIYKLYKAEDNIVLELPEDYNRLSVTLKKQIPEWIKRADNK